MTTLIAALCAAQCLLVPAPKRIALLVAISDYNRCAYPDVPWRPLETKPDLIGMRQALDGWGFTDIAERFNEEATQAKIEDAFRMQLIEKAKPGDAIVFYYSGHGHQVINEPPNDNELDGKDEVLVTFLPMQDQSLPKETKRDRMYLRDDQIAKWLKQLIQKMSNTETKELEGSITFIFDSCNSGTSTRGWEIRKGRAWNDKIDGKVPESLSASIGDADLQDQTEEPSGWDGVGSLPAGVVFLAGCQSFESAHMLSGTPARGSAMTHFLVKALHEVRKQESVSYRDIFYSVNSSVNTLFSNQNPEMEGSTNMLLFGDGKSKHPENFVRLKKASSPTQITMLVGQVQGATVGSRYKLFEAGKPLNPNDPGSAIAEITSISPFESEARVTFTGTALSKEAVAGCRAILTHFVPSLQKMKVHVLPSHPLFASLSLQPFLSICSGAKPEEGTSFSLKGNVSPYILDRNIGDQKGLEPLQFESEAKVISHLRSSWQVQNLLAIENPTSTLNVDVELVKIKDSAELEMGDELRDEHRDNANANRPGRPFTSKERGCLVVRNRSVQPLNFSIIYPKLDGTIDVIPAPGESSLLIPANRKSYVLFSFRGTAPPYGSEILKVFATESVLDLSDFHTERAKRKAARGPNADLQNAIFRIQDREVKSKPILSRGPGNQWIAKQVVLITKK